jgi:hypothetical protein
VIANGGANMEALERIAEALERIAAELERDQLNNDNPPYVPQVTGHIPAPNRQQWAPEHVEPQGARLMSQECPIHHKPFRNGQYGAYCATRMPDGTWCKEKPRPAEAVVQLP